MNLGPLEDKELRFPVLPGLVPVQNTLSYPVHVGDLLQGTAGPIQGQGLKLRHSMSLKLQMFLKHKNFDWLHDTQHNDIQHNDTQHNDTQHNDIQNKGIICNTQYKVHSA